MSNFNILQFSGRNLGLFTCVSSIAVRYSEKCSLNTLSRPIYCRLGGFIMSRSQFNKTCVNLVKTAAPTVGVAAGILSVTYPKVELGLDRAAAQSKLPPPNVVVIMADDLSVGDLKVALSKGWMPNLKTHLINQGTTFTESFVSYSLCCPSRSTFLTGQYPHNHGVLGNSLPKGV